MIIPIIDGANYSGIGLHQIDVAAWRVQLDVSATDKDEINHEGQDNVRLGIMFIHPVTGQPCTGAFLRVNF